MSNLYDDPEDFGLETVCQLDFSGGQYEFDYRVVWRRLSDGQLLSARDSGCSCPSPFEEQKIEDLQEVNSTSWLQEEIAEMMKPGECENGNLGQQAPEFIQKVEEALSQKAKRAK